MSLPCLVVQFNSVVLIVTFSFGGRSGGFDDFGLLPELVSAVSEMGWLYVLVLARLTAPLGQLKRSHRVVAQATDGRTR